VQNLIENKLTPQEIRFLVVSFLIVLVGLILLVSINVFAAQHLDGGGSIFLPWKAWRAQLVEGGSAYSGDTAHFVQKQVYGRSARAGQNPYVLNLPFHLMLLYFPFGMIADKNLVRGLFMALSEVGLILLALASLRLTDWQPRRLFAILFYIFTGLSVYSLLALREGTPAILLGLTYAGILLTLREDLDELTGALLALSFAFWEIGLPFILLVLARVFYQRRSRVFFGFIVMTFLLAGIAFLYYPGWVFPYIVGLFANWTVDFGITPGAVLIREVPQYGVQLGWAVTGLSLAILAYEWAWARGADFRRFYWVACLTLSITPLLGMRSAPENLVVLLPGIALIFATVRERWKAGYWLTVSLLLIFFAAPWVLFLGEFSTVIRRTDALFLFLPVVTVIGLYWIRWWVIRPPRTWTERVSHPEYR